jgi:hypothetical protein
MRYVNFDLELFNYSDARNIESFAVRVVSSPAGQQKLSQADVVQLPLDARTLIRRLERRGIDQPGILRLGAMLGDALFPPSVRRLYENSRNKLKENQGLRVRLRLDHFALANIPWEYVYVPRPDGQASVLEGFLALDRHMSIVRFEVLDQPTPRLAPTGGPLRFVGVMSSPVNLEPLRLDRERAMLEQALGTVMAIQATIYENASTDMLIDAFSQPAHIFHFAGHGAFEPTGVDAAGSREGKGVLYLENRERQAVPVPAEHLALILQRRDVRLAVLGGCQTGQRDSVNAWTGVAPALVRAGIPAVVGMQHRILDISAIAFNRQFYLTLAEGHEVDFAVHQARLAMMTGATSDNRDWGVPVLYMRSDDGVLFPPPEPEPGLPAARAVGSAKRAAGPTNTIVDSVSTLRKPTPKSGGKNPLPPPRKIGGDAQPGVFRGAGAAQTAPDLILIDPGLAIDRRAQRAENIGARAPAQPLALRVQLGEALFQRFHIGEIELLCGQLGVDFDAIPGDTRLLKARGLIDLMDRASRLHELSAAMRARKRI